MRSAYPLIVSGAFLTMLCAVAPAGPADAASKKPKPALDKSSPAVQAAQRYAEAIASGDQVATGQLDFACQYKMAAAGLKAFPPPADPLYKTCWEPLAQTHRTVVLNEDEGMNVVWPGKGGLVFFREPLETYGASFFVMDVLGLSPPGGGLKVEPVASRPIPAASFRLKDDAPTLGAPTTLVTLKVSYRDALSSPISYSPGTYQWANTVKRPRSALKWVETQWVVLTGLKKKGFPGDVAVVNLPVSEQEGARIPFATERSRYVDKSAAWFGPADVPGTLLAAVARTRQFPELRDRVAMLNRVLIVDPDQMEALGALTQDLYQVLLASAQGVHGMALNNAELAERFNELYWDIYAQTDRMDISLGMEMGGLAKPTPADLLYRLIPAMERLVKLYPDNLEARLRLGTVYRWNNDQLPMINTHEALVRAIPPERYQLRTRALLELAWSRIAKVSWNRNFDDPNIVEAYREAEEAYKFTDRPVDKFAAAYTMAYSLAFTPNRNNQAMLDWLTEAQRWFLELEGASPAAWRYLLSNDNLKGVLEADPIFKPLLAAQAGQ